MERGEEVLADGHVVGGRGGGDGDDVLSKGHVVHPSAARFAGLRFQWKVAASGCTLGVILRGPACDRRVRVYFFS
jgi:hypothetical protein